MTRIVCASLVLLAGQAEAQLCWINGYSTILALAVAILALNPGRAYAQEPATYDYDASTAGVQGPTSPLFANPFTRFFRTISVNVPLLVAAADLQAALPPGFNAVPDALGRASIFALFSFQVTNAEHAPATPYQTLVLQAAATNTYLNRVENLVLARFNSSQEAVNAENLTTGGGVWLADFEWEVGQKRGELDIRVEIDAGTSVSRSKWPQQGPLRSTSACGSTRTPAPSGSSTPTWRCARSGSGPCSTSGSSRARRRT